MPSSRAQRNTGYLFLGRRGFRPFLAKVCRRSWRAGAPAPEGQHFSAQLNAQVDPTLQAVIDSAGARRQSAMTLIERASWPCSAIADAVREESREAVQRLHEQWIEVIMMTGDPQAVARSLGELGIQVTPVSAEATCHRFCSGLR